jgi:nucleotide-binding universal stress UspA family protein
MFAIRKILCPTDHSEFSSRALAYAIPIARWYEATITALHVYTISPLPPTKIPPASHTHLSPEARETMLDVMGRFTKPARSAGVVVDEVVVEGDPVEEIVQQARRADLLVMGTHGRRGFERLVLGSVTEKVLRKSPCPVLTVPRHAPGSPPGDAFAFKRILCPVDFSDSSRKALEFALSLAMEADAKLGLLHVIEQLSDMGQPEVARFDLRAYAEYLERGARDRLAALIPEDAREWCRPEVVVVPGKAHRGILKVAEERRSDLIVMGVAGRGGIDRMVFGSTAAQVVREAACPVLTVRSA